MESIPTLMSNASMCLQNCGPNGECVEGTCVCYVQYSGGSCNKTNLQYYVSFSAFFYLICMAAFVLLMLRICSEFNRSSSSILSVFKVDIQKLIYFFVICATGSRAVYFLLGIHDVMPPVITKLLFFIFYLFMLSGFSLIICFWAESFHLSGLELDKPRFLTKSFCGFVLINLVVYVVFIGLVVANVLDISIAEKMNEVLNVCVAFLMFFVLVFFLIYGIELFCKIKGAFKKGQLIPRRNRINYDQLVQSRIGLLVEACFQIILAVLLIYEVTRKNYQSKLTIIDRNILKVLFHVVELGCVMWFPCCLWNVKRPGRLWILNPQNLFTTVDDDGEDSTFGVDDTTTYNTFADDRIDDDNKLLDSTSTVGDDANVSINNVSEHNNNNDNNNNNNNIKEIDTEECWICLSNENFEDMIQPCNCKGGMKVVHHNCLKTWIMERAPTDIVNERPKCDVCKASYHVTVDTNVCCIHDKQQCITWSRTITISSVLLVIPGCLYVVWNRVHETMAKIAIFVLLLLVGYMFLKLLGFSFLKAYKITKRRALTILSKPEVIENSHSSGVWS